MLSVTPCPFDAKQAEVPGFEPGSRDSKSLMLSTTPYLQTALQATAAAHVFETHAATLPKPRSVALTAMTEGPLQRNLAVEFWSPHIAHLSGSANVMPDTYKSLSVFYRLPETWVCPVCAESIRTTHMRVTYLERKITFDEKCDSGLILHIMLLKRT